MTLVLIKLSLETKEKAKQTFWQTFVDHNHWRGRLLILPWCVHCWKRKVTWQKKLWWWYFLKGRKMENKFVLFILTLHVEAGEVQGRINTDINMGRKPQMEKGSFIYKATMV